VKRGVTILAVLVIIMLAGSVLTAGVWGGLPIQRQTSDPAGSYFAAPPGQAALFFIVVTALVAGALANGIIIGLILWFLNRESKIVASTPTRSQNEAVDSGALPEKAS